MNHLVGEFQHQDGLRQGQLQPIRRHLLYDRVLQQEQRQTWFSGLGDLTVEKSASGTA